MANHPVSSLQFVLLALSLVFLAACGTNAGGLPTSAVLKAVVVPTRATVTLSPDPATATRVSPTLTQTPPLATATATPVLPMATTTLPTGTPTPDNQFLKFPSNLCCAGRTVQAGRYELPTWLDIPLSVEVGEGWRSINEKAAKLFTLGKGRNSLGDASQLLVFLAAPKVGSPQTLLQSVRNAPEYVASGETTPATIAGFSGLQSDAATKPNLKYEGDPEADIPPGVQILPSINRFFTPGFLWTTSSPEARLRLIALDVNGQTILIYLEAPPDEFDAFVGEATKLLQTMEITTP